MEDVPSLQDSVDFIFGNELEDTQYDFGLDDVNNAFQCLLAPENDVNGQADLEGPCTFVSAFDDWTVCTKDPGICISDPTLIRIKIRSRDEDDEYNIVPAEMFSCLSYTMHISLDRLLLTSPTHKPIVIAHITAVDTDGVEVKTADNQSAISGPQEHITLDVNEKESRLECRIPMKWLCVSWNHGKKCFQMRIEFQSFVEGQAVPLLTATSKPFTTLARRPRVSTRTNIKPKFVTDKPVETKKRKVRIVDQEPKKPRKKPKTDHEDPINKAEQEKVVDIEPEGVPINHDLEKVLSMVALVEQAKSKLSAQDQIIVDKAIGDILTKNDEFDLLELISNEVI